jgi:hypothetical protein
MATEVDNTIYGGNGYEFEYPIVKKDDTTGAKVPATGLVGLTARVSATSVGAAIHASLTTPLAERRAKPGTYYGRILGANIETNLIPNYDGKTVYIVVADAAGEIRGSTAVKVKDVRKV